MDITGVFVFLLMRAFYQFDGRITLYSNPGGVRPERDQNYRKACITLKKTADEQTQRLC